MKNKKGFTLIELLAVIVILAIIALIATPIVMNVIENSRKGAAERSAENYMDAVETAIMEARLDGTILADGTYSLAELEADDKLGTIEVSGNKPTEGSIKISNGSVVTDSETILKVGDYEVSYNADGKIFATKSTDSNTPVVVYRWTEDTINIEDPIDPSAYTTDPTTLGKNVYLKHVVENNIVKESYVCAVLEGKEVCVRGGSTDYYGYEADPANYTGNVLILKGLQDEGISCGLGESDSRCNDCGLGESDCSVYLNAFSDGYVYAEVGNDRCDVDVFGYSSCISK